MRVLFFIVHCSSLSEVTPPPAPIVITDRTNAHFF